MQQVMWRPVVAEKTADGIRYHHGELKQAECEAFHEAERMADSIENVICFASIRVVA